jgi:hypothetical protein
LTRNEIRRLFTSVLTRTLRAPTTSPTGHDGAVDTRPKPRNATTDARQPSHDHEVGLEY